MMFGVVIIQKRTHAYVACIVELDFWPDILVGRQIILYGFAWLFQGQESCCIQAG